MDRKLMIALLASAALVGACNRENDNNKTGTNTTPSGSTMNSNSGTNAGNRSTATTPRSTTPAGTATPAPTMTPPSGAPATNEKKDENAALTTEVRNALAADTAIHSAAGLTIYSDKDGEVTVKGTVPSQDEKDRIGAKIVTLPGVKKVDNKIDVKEPKPQSP